MGLIDKLMFWKKEDDFGFDKIAAEELQKAGIEDDPFRSGMNEGMSNGLDNPALGGTATMTRTDFGAPATRPGFIPQQAGGGMSGNRDIELISSKLDTIKAMLNSVDQRLASVERSLGTEQKQKLW